MKKSTNLIALTFLVVIAIFVIGFIQPDKNSIEYSLNTQVNNKGNKISELINAKKLSGVMKEYSLFSFNSKDVNKGILSGFVREGVALKLQKNELKKVLDENSENIKLSIPKSDNTVIELELTRINMIPKGFKLKDVATGRLTDYTERGLYYRGIIKGDNNSMAAISIFDNFVMGVVADGSGNYTLGSVKNAGNNYTENYVFYNDKDQIHQTPFKCGLEGREDKFRVENINNSKHVPDIGDNSNALADDTIKVYYETDHQMYLDFNNSQTAVFQYVSGFFNVVALIYENEQIHFAMSTQFGYWTTVDPYLNMTASDEILNKFGENQKDNFMGDLAQFLTTAHNGGDLGGIAWINVLCQPATQQGTSWVGRFSFANINSTYSSFPTYSWTVTVSTHEMGHNLGSYHTHSCHWDLGTGAPGPLDTCVVTGENSASSGGCINANPQGTCYQSNGLLTGFIMSYCHFCADQGGGIHYINGFGRNNGSNISFTQSGDTIRLRVQQASCLHFNLNSSEVPTTFALLQNFPNPFNPATNIKFALPAEGFVTIRIYDITGREVTKLLDSKYYAVGVYNVSFDAAGMGLASGVYLYRLDVTNGSKNVFTEIKKMVLIK